MIAREEEGGNVVVGNPATNYPTFYFVERV